MVPRRQKHYDDDTVLTINVTGAQKKAVKMGGMTLAIIVGVPVIAVLAFTYGKLLALLLGFILGADFSGRGPDFAAFFSVVGAIFGTVVTGVLIGVAIEHISRE